MQQVPADVNNNFIPLDIENLRGVKGALLWKTPLSDIQQEENPNYTVHLSEKYSFENWTEDLKFFQGFVKDYKKNQSSMKPLTFNIRNKQYLRKTEEIAVKLQDIVIHSEDNIFYCGLNMNKADSNSGPFPCFDFADTLKNFDELKNANENANLGFDEKELYDSILEKKAEELVDKLTTYYTNLFSHLFQVAKDKSMNSLYFNFDDLINSSITRNLQDRINIDKILIDALKMANNDENVQTIHVKNNNTFKRQVEQLEADGISLVNNQDEHSVSVTTINPLEMIGILPGKDAFVLASGMVVHQDSSYNIPALNQYMIANSLQIEEDNKRKHAMEKEKIAEILFPIGKPELTEVMMEAHVEKNSLNEGEGVLLESAVTYKKITCADTVYIYANKNKQPSHENISVVTNSLIEIIDTIKNSYPHHKETLNIGLPLIDITSIPKYTYHEVVTALLEKYADEDISFTFIDSDKNELNMLKLNNEGIHTIVSSNLFVKLKSNSLNALIIPIDHEKYNNYNPNDPKKNNPLCLSKQYEFRGYPIPGNNNNFINNAASYEPFINIANGNMKEHIQPFAGGIGYLGKFFTWDTAPKLNNKDSNDVKNPKVQLPPHITIEKYNQYRKKVQLKAYSAAILKDKFYKELPLTFKYFLDAASSDSDIVKEVISKRATDINLSINNSIEKGDALTLVNSLKKLVEIVKEITEIDNVKLQEHTDVINGLIEKYDSYKVEIRKKELIKQDLDDIGTILLKLQEDAMQLHNLDKELAEEISTSLSGVVIEATVPFNTGAFTRKENNNYDVHTIFETGLNLNSYSGGGVPVPEEEYEKTQKLIPEYSKKNAEAAILSALENGSNCILDNIGKGTGNFGGKYGAKVKQANINAIIESAKEYAKEIHEAGLVIIVPNIGIKEEDIKRLEEVNIIVINGDKDAAVALLAEKDLTVSTVIAADPMTMLGVFGPGLWYMWVGCASDEERAAFLTNCFLLGYINLDIIQTNGELKRVAALSEFLTSEINEKTENKNSSNNNNETEASTKQMDCGEGSSSNNNNE